MIGVGVIGCGKIAQVRHIPEYADSKDAELRGYYDPHFDRAQAMASRYGGKAYETIDALLADESIGAVSVCLANSAHADVTIKALNAGKDVLCEKPMAVTLAECEAMVAASDKTGKFLMIDQNQRLARAHVKAKELIEQGIIGSILTFRTTFGHGGPETWSIDGTLNTWFFDKKRAAMGAMADLGVHKTDLIQYLVGSKVVEVNATITTLDKRYANGELIGVDDNAICIYKMENGVIGTMTASWTYYGEEDNSTVLYGTKGIMKIYSNPAFSIEVVNRNGERVYYDLEKIQTNDNQTKSGVIDAFIDCLVHGHERQISGQSVLNAMRAVFGSVESSETGKTVKVNQ
ncbi:MAG: Gfo/Idh/MocA family oxidoreductase [Synergistaceae bacterium]|nr:Gfo/Idh/MocA family oxidoreductase [Synergistaceae bacterium]